MQVSVRMDRCAKQLLDTHVCLFDREYIPSQKLASRVHTTISVDIVNQIGVWGP